MKKTKILWVLPLLILSACGSETTSDVPQTSQTTEKIDFAKKFDSLKGNLKMTGTISYKFYNEVSTGKYEPTDGEPVTSNLNVTFSDDGYVVSYNGDFDENFTETLFKSDDNTVELRYINNKNQLIIERGKDKEGKEVSFDKFTNPFASLTNDDLTISDDGLEASIDTKANLEKALFFTHGFTYYNFPSLEKVSILADENKVTNIHIESGVIPENIRNGTYTFDLTVEAFGDDVTGPVTPTPLTTNERQDVIYEAFNELMNNDLEFNLSVSAWGLVTNQNYYSTSTVLFCDDQDDKVYSQGFFKDDEKFFRVFYTRSDEKFFKEESKYYTDDSFNLPWTFFDKALYIPTEDSNEFTLSSTVSTDNVAAFAYNLSGKFNTDLTGMENLKVYLDVNNHIEKLCFSNAYKQEATFKITKIGQCNLPFDLKALDVSGTKQ